MLILTHSYMATATLHEHQLLCCHGYTDPIMLLLMLYYYPCAAISMIIYCYSYVATDMLILLCCYYYADSTALICGYGHATHIPIDLFLLVYYSYHDVASTAMSLLTCCYCYATLLSQLYFYCYTATLALLHSYAAATRPHACILLRCHRHR